jgi:molybdopterin molybdotransferase
MKRGGAPVAERTTMTAMPPLPGEALLTVDDARARILAACAPLPAERLPLTAVASMAPPPRLAGTLVARRALPPFSNSAMDGYGVRVADVAGASAAAPVSLRIVGRSLAGAALGASGIGGQMAVEITTGAPIPGGVDAVVMRERCDETWVADKLVRVKQAVVAGENIRQRGEDVEEGAVVGTPGDPVTPARLNLLLSAGHVVADVVRRPTVAILASGDELREVGEGAGDEAIVNSNAWAIAAAATAAGARVRMLGIAADTLADHVARMDVDDVDVLVTIGGASVGSHDFVRPAFAELGGSLSLWRIAMRPGKPLAFGTLPSRRRPVLFFGLPGNPVSALVTFTLFVAPALRALQGDPAPAPTPLRLPLHDAAAFEKKRGLAFFARARVVVRDGVVGVVTLDRQGSGQVSGLADATCLVALPADVDSVSPGALVEVIGLDGAPSASFVPAPVAVEAAPSPSSSPSSTKAQPVPAVPPTPPAASASTEPADGGGNRRQFERVPARFDVRVDAGQQNVRASSTNVSLGGMFVRGADHLCRAGDLVDLVVHVPGPGGEELHVLRARVAQVVGGTGIGVRFEWHQSMERARAALVRFLERAAADGGNGGLEGAVIPGSPTAV